MAFGSRTAPKGYASRELGCHGLFLHQHSGLNVLISSYSRALSSSLLIDSFSRSKSKNSGGMGGAVGSSFGSWYWRAQMRSAKRRLKGGKETVAYCF